MRITILTFLILISSLAAAGGVVNIGGAQSLGVAASISQNETQNANTFNSTTSSAHRSDHDYSKLAPPVAPAPLVSSYSQDVCLGSVTGGVSGGGFGISAGTTTLDHDCVQRRDIRLLHNLGHSDAALAMACQDLEMGAALRSVGKCPAVVSKQESLAYSFEELD